ncbi:hypothetical protein ACFT2C_12015 [Promicromonospora sp. NPDC057138]|uniref:hypothetical protein n=1 Tax=Promicromonospora sp. NPDC057138 TaxID=3346031 RepID=UPI00362C298E
MIGALIALTLTLIELALVGRSLREMPVTEGMTADLIRQTISDDDAESLLDHAPRVLGPGSEEYDLWHEAGPETFAEWTSHANKAVADLRRALSPGPDHPDLFSSEDPATTSARW